jgi:hypothetical protein
MEQLCSCWIELFEIYIGGVLLKGGESSGLINIGKK